MPSRTQRVASSEIAIALDCAASELFAKGKYTFKKSGAGIKTAEEMVEMYAKWCNKYPIVSIEDPLAEDDSEGFAAFTKAVGCDIQVVGDDFLVSDAALLRQEIAQTVETPAEVEAEVQQLMQVFAR
mgnify:CR=1 FL=1